MRSAFPFSNWSEVGTKSDQRTQCTVVPGTIVTVTPAGAVGLNASGPLGLITGSSITVNLAAGTTTGALAQSGADISFNGSTLNTTSVGAAANGQLGLRATGAGSQITATGATINMVPPREPPATWSA